MPTVSMFYGIIIRMFYNDHLPPHFHAEYSGQKVVYDFSGKEIEGKLPPVQRHLVQAWVDLHKAELEANWELAKDREELFRIEPLR
ncbi:MAG: DUF4160 domain-containing protein [Christensenellaceae bacterium]|jgi:hypothetical protein|nr:DUF4160 domain-containing protein [Christensenellaceae bacterium]